jgi:hypothetical protein
VSGCSVGSEKGWAPAATISTPRLRARSLISLRKPGNSRARSAADAKTGESISTHDCESSEVMSFVPFPAASTPSTAGVSPRETGSTSWNSSSTPTV